MRGQAGHQHNERARRNDGTTRDTVGRAPEHFGGIGELAVAQLLLVGGVHISKEVALAQIVEARAAQRGRIDALQTQRFDGTANGFAETDLLGQRAQLGRQAVAAARQGLVDRLVEQRQQIEGVADAQAVADDVVRDQLVGQLPGIGGLEADPATLGEGQGTQ